MLWFYTVKKKDLSDRESLGREKSLLWTLVACVTVGVEPPSLCAKLFNVKKNSQMLTLR